MALCPNCNAAVPSKLALKSVDVLLFPAEGAEKCPSCRTPLVPEKSSILGAVLLLVALVDIFFVFIHYRVGGFNPGPLGSFLAGFAVSLGGLFLSAKLIRFNLH